MAPEKRKTGDGLLDGDNENPTPAKRGRERDTKIASNIVGLQKGFFKPSWQWLIKEVVEKAPKEMQLESI